MSNSCGITASCKIVGVYPGYVCAYHEERLRRAIDIGEIKNTSWRLDFLSQEERFYENKKCNMQITFKEKML